MNMRLRLTDRKVDLTTEGLDLAFFLGQPEDSNLRIKKIADVQRVLCASPAYIATHGHPRSGHDIVKDKHECLNLRFPGATEFQWPLDDAIRHQKVSCCGALRMRRRRYTGRLGLGGAWDRAETGFRSGRAI